MDFLRTHLRTVAAALIAIGSWTGVAVAQEKPSAEVTLDAVQTADPLSEEELEVLVARIALYPDQLVALISEASLYPLQIVEASRFLDQIAKKASVKPKDTWDGSVISLLNYPEIVKMMSDDLDWIQTLADALTYQQKDVLIAIQQLREKAVADGTIKTDSKATVVEEGDNIVIRPTNADSIYVPRYEPEMLYAADYPVAPVTYYPEPYPSYYYPTAPYFAGIVTGAIWGAAIAWDDWSVWGGRWDGNDIDIDCNNCFNNVGVNGKINLNDVDWKNIDRSKMSFDKSQFAKLDKTSIGNRIKTDSRNSFRNRASDINKERIASLPTRSPKLGDVRKSKIEEGLKAKPVRAGNPNLKKADMRKPVATTKARSGAKSTGKVNRPVGKPKPAMRMDNRPKKPSGLGSFDSGKRQQIASSRGARSMGGGMRNSGGSHKAVRRAGGGGRRR